ncbi:hypothetical protein GJAV_G00234800 [Gymnothorax javanicus]|nr:hypothetical protein GJAV_G00234800 [Gymnothorax javanicus]
MHGVRRVGRNRRGPVCGSKNRIKTSVDLKESKRIFSFRRLRSRGELYCKFEDLQLLESEVVLMVMALRRASVQENLERIQAVESSFGPSGKPLKKLGRILVGEGRLMKLCRHGSPEPRVFFLFNDILVYGRIVFQGRWYRGQQLIPLEHVKVEDVEDSEDMKNQWLLCTPRKSFYVSASSPLDKRAWISHIEEWRAKRVKEMGSTPELDFASSWVPDSAAEVCMRCVTKFTFTQRRHHCRECGYVVCDSCSNNRALIPNISSKSPVRVCKVCFPIVQSKRNRGGSEGLSDETSDDEESTEVLRDSSAQQWEGQQVHVVQGWASYTDN